MHSLEKDYEYLLLKLVPYHRLGHERRRLISRALQSGDQAAMRRAAVQALEDLCSTGYFNRTETAVENGRSLVTYVPRKGNFQLRLQVPTEELQGAPTLTGAVQPRAAAEVMFEIIPDIMRTFSITAQSMLERLEATVDLLPPWFGFSAARLVLLEERLGDKIEGDTVTTEPESEVLKKAVNAHCRRTGLPEFLHPEAALALGLQRPQRINRQTEAPGQVAVSPVFSVGEFWGILEWWLPDSNDGPAVRSRIEVATGMIEQIIENAVRLENLTSMDKLTGLYNRNFYDDQVGIEIERAKRSSTSLTMLIADIDDFKRINDTYGHAVGDSALMLIADSIKGNLRKIDLAFRYGGEEFVILLPGTGQLEAIHTAERVRSVIEELRDLHGADGTEVPLRVSIGGAVYPDDAGGKEELFNKADKALYKAKQDGKNRVQFFSDL